MYLKIYLSELLHGHWAFFVEKYSYLSLYIINDIHSLLIIMFNLATLSPIPDTLVYP